ncbi:glycosyltransferase family 9 protein [Tenacibaculum jejuense]|uniref:Glycosyl transferase, group 9 family protein n=1 Tax=Tenacibaculum jejuense TaxID=584609 RepID=A0A238U5C5_9FLAO|nr:glycosyltransferase family 9 protein [Tenacibaculum jejuense]SNR14235.1 Glycosyl transferase, group 9 family protein [Tenacibaculum jejuense]
MKKKEHIIVFRLSAMGDVAMTVPVVKALVQQHPNKEVTVVSKKFLAPLFEDIENVNFFTAEVTSKHKGFLGLIRLYKELKKLQPTHFADLHNVLRSKVVRTLFQFFSSIKVSKIDKGRKEKKLLTAETKKTIQQLKTSHQRYVDVFSDLGFSINLNEVILNTSPLNSVNISKLGNKTKPWIGIAPFAAFDSKTYPLDLLEQVIDQLTQNDIKIFLFGGKNDTKILEELEKKYSNTISLAGKLSGLQNELNVIENLDVMLSMDSGNAHLAAMKNVKTITLWGNTHPYAGFAPFNQPKDFCILPDLDKFPLLPCSIYGNKTFEGYEDVMRSIDPHKIVKKIESII